MNSELTDATWYLAQLKPNSHRIAERNLQRQKFQTFLPLQEVVARKNEKFASKLRPLFPGYIFLAFDPASGGWGAINNTYGITNLVSFGDVPVSIPHTLISELMARCDDTGKILPPTALKPDDSVKLTSGPFADFVATVDKITPDQRVWVLLDLMGRTTRVSVAPAWLLKI